MTRGNPTATSHRPMVDAAEPREWRPPGFTVPRDIGVFVRLNSDRLTARRPLNRLWRRSMIHRVVDLRALVRKIPRMAEARVVSREIHTRDSARFVLSDRSD
ncbi:predicted protein [Coccidioides posadasii str. Silveira]|uniref:Predicted protein n=1 Tax=Coccidioides posadasii (strain RMSCC 757 / Silveira) TaxID=443226 RepID=E9DBH8_COCPS|nr:predicted protein [Coccidioides posadasii str. Silveira]